MFSQALVKENELNRLSLKTDSLRKLYANSSSIKREELADYILKNEERSIELNSEIPILYRSVRENELQYWQSATENQKFNFHEIIKVYLDSIADSKITETKEKETQKIDNESQAITLPVTELVKENKISTETITYKIQIGAFKNKIPESAKKTIDKLSIIRKVENYTDGSGINIFTAGNLKSYEQAVLLQSQIKQEGAKNPIIIAFENDKKISVAEARKITNE